MSCDLNTISHFHDCTFHRHRVFGLFLDRSTVHLYGESTAVHSNRNSGIFNNNTGKVIIHLPSHHNTVYNNRRRRSTHTKWRYYYQRRRLKSFIEEYYIKGEYLWNEKFFHSKT